MKLLPYLKDCALPLVVGALIASAICGIVAVCGAGASAVAVAASLCVVCAASTVALRYVRKRRYYCELDALAQRLEHPWQLPSLLDEPDFYEGRIAHNALADMSRAASDEVNTANAELSAYREYIEAWVHEVKAPIAAASLAAERVGGADAEKLQHDLDRIERLVDQALWHARAESVEADYAIRSVPLALIVRNACKANARFLIEKGVSPAIDIAEDVVVCTDVKWAAFVIAQGLVNAAKYGAAQVVFHSNDQAKDTPLGCTLLEVADDGAGIPAAEVPHVFDRGFVGSNGRCAESSTGMGLYLAAKICAKMGVGIRIASEEGAGTRLLLEFPQDRRRMELATRRCNRQRLSPGRN